MHARGDENCAVEAARASVSGLVQEAPLFEEGVENSAILRKGSAARCDPTPRLIRRRLQVERERAFGERGTRRRLTEPTTTKLDHRGLPAREDLHCSVLLKLAKRRLAVRREELRDARARALFDDLVDRDKPTTEPLGENRTERRLPRAHESDEHEMAAERVQDVRGQRIRSRYAACAATKSTSASPPNFSLATNASSQATAASATTASASTA